MYVVLLSYVYMKKSSNLLIFSKCNEYYCTNQEFRIHVHNVHTTHTHCLDNTRLILYLMIFKQQYFLRTFLVIF